MNFRSLTCTLLGLVSFSTLSNVGVQAQTPVVPPTNFPAPNQQAKPVQAVPAPAPTVQPSQPTPPPAAQRVVPMPPPPPGQQNFQIPPPTTGVPLDLNSPGVEATLPATINVSGIAATVNGQPITYKYLVTKWLQEGATAANFLDELINEQLIRQEAKKEGVTVTKAETDAKLLEAKKVLLPQYPGETWAQFLATQGRSESYLRDNIYDGLLAVKLVERTMPAPSLTNKVHLFHILKLTVQVPGAATPASDTVALKEIEDIRALIVSGKVTFQEEARKESQDSSASKGGDLGWVGPDAQLDPNFSKAAFALKEGEISQPVKSQYGWHLIYAAKLGSHATPADILEYKSGKEMQDRARAQLQPYLRQLRKSAKIVAPSSAAVLSAAQGQAVYFSTLNYTPPAAPKIMGSFVVPQNGLAAHPIVVPQPIVKAAPKPAGN